MVALILRSGFRRLSTRNQVAFGLGSSSVRRPEGPDRVCRKTDHNSLRSFQTGEVTTQLKGRKDMPKEEVLAELRDPSETERTITALAYDLDDQDVAAL